MRDAERWRRELRHCWPMLAPRTTTEITTTPLETSTTEPVRVGVDGGGARHLLVPLLGSDLRGDDGESALAMRVRTYTFSRSPARYLDVACTRPDLFDGFDKVLVDILLGVEETPSTAAATTVEIVTGWRALLATRRGDALTVTAQMSLFAELAVLAATAPPGGPLKAEWWRGPRREPHDIQLPDRALEVKAVGATSTSIEIHGLAQLDPPGRPLALVVATLAESDDGRTLPDLVDEALPRFDRHDEAVRLLNHAGYSRADSDRYTARFTIIDLRSIEIDDSVPRIVAASFGASGVPDGVAAVVYRIELSALTARMRPGAGAIRAWVEGAPL